jgi:hypothetical protein
MIPVTFDFKGKEYKGFLSKVSGASNDLTFDLTVDGFYWGKFFYVEGGPGIQGLHAVEAGWRLSGNKEGIEELRDYFERVVVAWYG